MLSLNSNPGLRALSYLHARDPSVFMGVGVEHVDQKVLYEENSEENSSSLSILQSSTDEEDDKNIQVYLRIKNNIPFDDLYEIDGNTLICKVPPNSNVLRNLRNGESMTRMYTFSRILDPTVTQLQIFNGIVKRKMVNFLNGTNTTIFTYGASGSGKTFTIVGTAEEPGLIPRALEYLFRSLPVQRSNSTVKPMPNGGTQILSSVDYKKEMDKTLTLINSFISQHDRQKHIRTYKDMQQRLSEGTTAIVETSTDVALNVWVSFAEIYNENIYDLLVQSPPLHKQRPKLSLSNMNAYTYIRDLTSVPVSSGLEAYQVLQCGIHNLNYAATAVNSHSSRSHSIFTIKLMQNGSNGCRTSYFNFCDLAGSERLKKTGNVGDRLKESNNINKSLMVLGRCIDGIRSSRSNGNDSQYKLVPFRESKLTRLFQNALTGLEDMSIIITMNPSLDMFDETHHVLNFSAIAKDIIIERPKRCSLLSNYMSEIGNDDNDYYKNMCEELRYEMEAQREEFQLKLEEEHSRLNEGYQKVMKTKVQLEVDAMKRKHKEEIMHLKAFYEKRLAASVIDLVSSDSESDEETCSEKKDVVEDLKRKFAEKDELLKQQADEIERLKRQLNEFDEEKRKTRRLTGILTDSNVDLKALELENIRLLKENTELREKIENYEVLDEMCMTDGSTESE